MNILLTFFFTLVAHGQWRDGWMQLQVRSSENDCEYGQVLNSGSAPGVDCWSFQPRGVRMEGALGQEDLVYLDLKKYRIECVNQTIRIVCQ